jgi:hypothetical protein
MEYAGNGKFIVMNGHHMTAEGFNLYCALAWWGRAMTLIQIPPLGNPISGSRGPCIISKAHP